MLFKRAIIYDWTLHAQTSFQMEIVRNTGNGWKTMKIEKDSNLDDK